MKPKFLIMNFDRTVTVNMNTVMVEKLVEVLDNVDTPLFDAFVSKLEYQLERINYESRRTGKTHSASRGTDERS